MICGRQSLLSLSIVIKPLKMTLNLCVIKDVLAHTAGQQHVHSHLSGYQRLYLALVDRRHKETKRCSYLYPISSSTSGHIRSITHFRTCLLVASIDNLHSETMRVERVFKKMELLMANQGFCWCFLQLASAYSTFIRLQFFEYQKKIWKKNDADQNQCKAMNNWHQKDQLLRYTPFFRQIVGSHLRIFYTETPSCYLHIIHKTPACEKEKRLLCYYYCTFTVRRCFKPKKTTQLPQFEIFYGNLSFLCVHNPEKLKWIEFGWIMDWKQVIGKIHAYPIAKYRRFTP